jgi:hypothetical protein
MFKGLTARHLYTSFGVKELTQNFSYRTDHLFNAASDKFSPGIKGRTN